jgi:hypothetical protein
MLNVNFGNEKPVTEFVDFICDRMKTINSSWVEIAQALYEAREMYGNDSLNYKTLLKDTKFAKSTANKFIAIASSKRLKEYDEKLSAVNSWATLYAIHSMSDAKFEELVSIYKLNEEGTVPPFITLTNVNSILKEKTKTDPHKIYAKIRIDEEALISQVFDGDMLSKIEELLNQIETTFPYLIIERTGIDEKAHSQFQNKLAQEKGILDRQSFNNAIKGRLKQRQKNDHESQADYEIRALGMSRQELWEMFIENPKSAFAFIGYEYDEAEIFDKAYENANKWADKIGEKLNSRVPDPFKIANTVLLAA